MGNIVRRVLICPGEARCLFWIRDERGQSEQQRLWDGVIHMKSETPYYWIQTGTHAHMWCRLTRAIRHKFEGDRKKWSKGQWNSERQEPWCNNINIITASPLSGLWWNPYNCKDHHKPDVLCTFITVCLHISCYRKL